MEENPDIPDSFYGKWSDVKSKTEKKKPNEKEFSLPTTQDELDEMMINMKKSGFDKDAVIKIFKERKARYDQAVDEYEKAVTESLSTSQCQ